MKFRQIFAFWYRNALMTKRSLPDLFTIICWPLTFMLSMGLFAFFVADSKALIILIIGSMGWSYSYASQVDASYTLVREIWWKSVKRLWLLPLSGLELIIANWSYGLFRAASVFILCSMVATFAFSFNPLATNLLWLSLFLSGMSLFGLGVGLIINSVVFRFGEKADVLIWSTIDILLLFSCVFWPFAALPSAFKFIAQFSPLTWAFEGLRALYLTNQFNFIALLRLYLLDVAFVIIAAMIFLRAERAARKTGFFQKYD